MTSFKKPFYFALVFFGTLIVLTVGYAAYSLSTEITNAPLTSTKWNNVINAVNDLDTRVTSLVSGGTSLWSTGATNSINYSAGNVGIGTVSPGAKLEVNGGITASGMIYIPDTDNTKSFVVGRGQIKSNGAGGFGGLSFLTYNGGYTEKMTIDGNGNVGIGTTSPGAKLDVTGKVNFYSSDGTTTAVKIYRPIVAYSDQIFNHASLYLGGSDNGYGLAMGVRNDNKVWLQAMVNNAAAWAGPILLAPDGGNVGIGTISPSERLDLWGGNVKMGYEQVSNDCVGTSVITCSVSCPAGKYVTGGGCMVDGSTAYVHRTYPSGVNQWTCHSQVALWNAGSVLRAYAICANIR